MPKLAPELRHQRLLNARTLRAMVRSARALAPVMATRGRSLGHRAVLLTSTILSAHTSMAQSLPQGGHIVAGSAAIAQPTANQMVITQSTQRVAINWQSFNIGTGNGVQFVQPSSSAIAVNRVIGLSGPSTIAGTLTANGQVYIVNPQGVVFGKGAMVNTGALVATTRDVDIQQFMAGGNITLAGGSTGNGRIVNAGTITTSPGGYVVLAGDRVINKGTIDTPNGRTVLAAGDQATVALSNGQLVNVTMNAAVANATVRNGGVIKAAGGKVLLTANGANSVLGGAVNVSGAIDVSAALAGDITVDAGPGGTVCASAASLKAVSTAGKGGNITLAGDRVGLFSGTRLNASGTTGGGTVRVGGGAHGLDSTVRNASATVVDPTASIDASATDKGDGGTVVVWSQDYTGFYGAITDHGGPNGGNGGWIETSSHDNLQAWGTVDAHAPAGAAGTWLLDPSNVTIAAAANASATFNTGNGTWSATQPNATINVAALNSQLSNGTSVTVTTTSANAAAGNININADIAKTGGGDASLTLVANGSINDNGANISSTSNALSVTMQANGTVTLANGSAFFLNGGTLSITGGLANNGSIGASVGQTTINAAAATIIGTTNSAAFAVNSFGTINASGTALLTINGTNGSTASVNFGAAVTANDLVVNGVAKSNGTGIVVGSSLAAAGNLSLNGTGNGTVNGTGVNVAGDIAAQHGNLTIIGKGNGNFGAVITGSACASGTVTINGSSSDGIAVNVAGTVNSSNGSVTITGTSSTGRGVRLSGLVAAAGTVTVNGSSDNANAIAVPANLTLAAAGGAMMIGMANTANAINISATLNATGTPLLTLNGTTADNGNLTFYGITIPGVVTGANLTVIGRGLSGANDTGGVNIAGATVASGNLTINGSANAGIAVNLTGTVNATAGGVTITGTSINGRGVRLAGTIAASGAVNVTGTSNSANGIAVPTNLSATITAGAGAILAGNAGAANGVNISGTLDATGTPLLTVNGTSTATDGGFYGVSVPGTLNVANLVVNGRGNPRATGDVGGTSVGGAINGTGNLTLNGQSNGTFSAVFFTGQATAGGAIVLNGAGNSRYGVNASGVLNAGGAMTINGTSSGAIGVLLNTSLTLAANGGAAINGESNSTHGVFLGGVLNATGAPSLVINGSTLASDEAYGVSFNGTANVVNLVLNGTGNLNAAGDVGGTTFGGTANATGNVTVIGRSNGTFSGIFFTGNIAAGGNAVLNGTGNNRYGVNASGTVNATGTVMIAGTSDGTTGVLLNSSLNLSADGGATILARSNSTNGFFFAGLLNASGTPLLTINGTSAAAGGNYNGIAFTGNASVANLTLNGVGNLTATGNVGGTTFNGTASASGNVTVTGQSNGGLQAVRLTGGIVACGSIVVNGSAHAAYGVDAGGTLNAGGTTAIIGSSDSNIGVFVGGCLTVTGGQGGAIAGSTNTGQYGVSLANGSALTAAGPLTVNGTGGLAMSGSLSAGGNVTLNANRFVLNGASFGGAAANLVLQALDTASALSINGSGASFGNVASVQIGGSSQAADLNLAAPLTYAGTGNLTVATGMANIALNANIDASAGSGSVILSAGNGVPLNASQSNGNVTGGDVLVGSATGLAAGEGATVVIYSGNANSAAYAALVANGATSQTKTYATLAGQGDVNASSALNLFYRVVPSLTVTLGNAAGANVAKTYDGVGVALGYNVTGMIDGDSPSSVAMTGNLAASAPLTNGQATHAGNYTISQGDATFTSGSHYAVSVANGSIVIAPRALTVTATTDTRTYDGTTASTVLATVTGNIAGDSFTNASLAEVFNSSHALGTNGSTLNVAGPLTNASLVTRHGCSGLSCAETPRTVGSYITDYNVTYVTAQGTITPKALTVTATSDTKVFDGSTSSNATMTVCGTIAGDSFRSSALGEVFASAAVAGANNSILLPAAPLGNASFATSTAGSWISDYSITYVAALGTILPTNGGSTAVVVPTSQSGGLASADVVSLGSWLNSGGQQQNLPPGLAMNDNVLHLMFTTNNGQPVIQASWAAFNSSYSGTINLPADTNPSPF